MEQLEKQLQGLEQAAADEAPADDQDGDQTGDQAKPAGDDAVTPGDRSAPDDEEDEHADQEGEFDSASFLQLTTCPSFCSFGLFSLLVVTDQATQNRL